jgi:hypothetical protein
MSKTYNVVKDSKEESEGGTSEISKLLLPISLQITFQSKNEIDNKNSYQNRFVSVKFSQYNYYYLKIVQQIHASKVEHGASQAIVGQGPANR